MLVTSFLLSFLFHFVSPLKYDPAAKPVDTIMENFGMQQLQDLYEDWDSIEMRPKVKFFPITVENLFRIKEKAKGIIDHISGEMFLTKLKINGFEDKSWQYWTTPNGTAPCDLCLYDFNGTEGAERYYGGFSARLRSLEAKLNVTVHGEEKECDLLGLALKTNSIAHATVAGEEGQIDDLNMFRLLYDFSFISSPPIGIEIKQWTVIDDWRRVNLASRFHLETMEDNGSWPPYRTDFYSPLFHVYVDPECLNISYTQSKYFNRKLSEHLDFKISGLVASAMKSHFLIQAGRPYALYKLENSGHSKMEWAMEMITSQQAFWDDVTQWFEGAGHTIVSGVQDLGDKAGRAALDSLRWVNQQKKDADKWFAQAGKDIETWYHSDEGQETIMKICDVIIRVGEAAEAYQTGGGGIKMPKFRPPTSHSRGRRATRGSVRSGLTGTGDGTHSIPEAAKPVQVRPALTQPPVPVPSPIKMTEGEGKPIHSGPPSTGGYDKQRTRARG